MSATPSEAPLRRPMSATSGNKGGRTKATFVTSFDFGTMEVAHKLTGAVDWEEETYQNTDPSGLRRYE